MRDLLALGKPRVVALVVFTAIAGMLLARSPWRPWVALCAVLGIALAATSAAALNQLLEARSDAAMARTRRRPVAAGRLSPLVALAYALLLAAASMVLLGGGVNALTAWLTGTTLLGYSIGYTLWLKRSTPQNIVIGGLAGAVPPLLGWTAMTGRVELDALLLVLIIFLWTPAHFWPLAIERRREYAAAGIPMMPVVRGVAATRRGVLIYTALMVAASLLPYMSGLGGPAYLAAALALGGAYLAHAIGLVRGRTPPMRVFRFSILYLALLFGALLIERLAP